MRVENWGQRQNVETGDDTVLVEIGRHGIVRVYIVGLEDDCDAPAEAHRLLAEVMPQLTLLHDALKTANQPK